MRKLTALTLAGIMTLGSALPAFADDNKRESVRGEAKFELQFKDWTNGYWANESLARMITKGVIKGNADGTIAQGRSVTRLEAAIMLARLLDLEAPELPEGEFKLKAPWGELEIENEDGKLELKLKTREGEVKIEDDDDIPAWGRDAILIALQHDFLLFDGARISPMASLNRLEAAIMLVKAAGLDAEAKARAGAELSFSDADKIKSELRGYIAIAVEKGFVTGYENGTFQPNKLVARAEWAALLDRLDRKGPDVSPDGRQIKGSVTAVAVGSAPSVTMTTPVFPNGVTYAFDDTAVIYKNGNAITIADVVAGDQVIINLSAERKILMLTVNNVVTKVSGTVTAYTAPSATTAGSLTITAEGKSTTYAVPAATGITLGGAAATLADLRPGDAVTLTLEGARLTQIAIKNEVKMVNAVLVSVTAGAANLLPVLNVTVGGQAVSYTVTDAATIKAAGGTALTIADLEASDELTLQVQRNLVLSIVRK